MPVTQGSRPVFTCTDETQFDTLAEAEAYQRRLDLYPRLERFIIKHFEGQENVGPRAMTRVRNVVFEWEAFAAAEIEAEERALRESGAKVTIVPTS